MSEAIITQKIIYAYLPVVGSNRQKTADSVYHAIVKVAAERIQDRSDGYDRLSIIVTQTGSEKKIQKMGVYRDLKCADKEAQTYLKALGWQGQCANGVHISYRTLK